MSDTNEGLCWEKAGHVATLTINRPDSRNGLTADMCRAMAAHLNSVASDEDIRAVVVTGAGDSFCSGLDLKSAAEIFFSGADMDFGKELREGFHAVIRALEALEVPTLCRMPGSAVGFGFDMALACDIRLGVRNAKYGSTFSRLGLMPDGGGTFSLQRIVGMGRAMELVLTGRTFDGDEGYQLGILSRVADDAEALDAMTAETVEALVTKPPLGLKHAKKAIRAAADGTLEDALGREFEGQLHLLQTEDLRTAVMGFFSKSTPEYKGR